MAKRETVIFHNPRCGTSRKTLELLQARGIEPKVVEYLNTPPSPAELKAILKLLGMGPREVIRKKEKLYVELGLDDPKLSSERLIQAMSENPILIERPIVFHAGKAVVARPSERVLEIL